MKHRTYILLPLLIVMVLVSAIVPGFNVAQQRSILPSASTDQGIRVWFDSPRLLTTGPCPYLLDLHAQTSNGWITNLHWDFGDGSKLDAPFSAQSVVSDIRTHIYSVGGTYFVNVTAHDSGGETGSASQALTNVMPGGCDSFPILNQPAISSAVVQQGTSLQLPSGGQLHMYATESMSVFGRYPTHLIGLQIPIQGRTLILKAMNAWNRALEKFQVEYGGKTYMFTEGTDVSIIFGPLPPGYSAETEVTYKTNVPVAGIFQTVRIILPLNFTYDIVLHELGHVLGLNEITRGGDVMCMYASQETGAISSLDLYTISYLAALPARTSPPLFVTLPATVPFEANYDGHS